MPPAEGDFRFVGERERFHGAFFNVVSATFLDPHGYTFEREIVRHPGAVVVVPIEDEHVLMVRQYRGAINRYVLELPAGKLDVPGEPKARAAARELAEEVGRVAEHLTELGSFHNSPGFTDERTTCFLAEGLTSVATDLQGIEEEHMHLEAVPLAEIDGLVARGELDDAKSMIALGLAARHLALRAG
ncbi:MAG TPA: NUDIX hydrolase [Acidimicrobiales bacterium]|nr:NUDIX hydrolase [Acidimicrobiales bacterium]